MRTGVTRIWTRACEVADQGRDPLEILAEFTRKKSDTEARFLQEFCSQAVRMGHRGRIRFHTLTLPDVPEYLSVHSVAPDAPAGATWETMHAEHQRAAKRTRFEDWMAEQHGADYSDAGLRQAAQSLDHLHTDLTRLLNAVRGTD